MAEKRMFSKKITDSDAFLDMPVSSQLLYFHLNMSADDDGFVNNPKRIQRNVNCSEDDMRLLIMKKFIIAFETGVIVIKHWKIHNYIANDRYKPTNYVEEMCHIELNENKSYSIKDGIYPKENGVYGLDTKCIQDVFVDKISIDEIKQGKDMRHLNPSDVEKQKQTSSKSKCSEEETKFFEEIWLLYPRKNGKAEVKDKQRKILYKLGFEVIKKCIDRYLAENKNPQYQKYGCKFFNSVYIDYLDENYSQRSNNGETEQRAVGQPLDLNNMKQKERFQQ